MDILNLPHFRILTRKETEYDRQIELETITPLLLLNYIVQRLTVYDVRRLTDVISKPHC